LGAAAAAAVRENTPMVALAYLSLFSFAFIVVLLHSNPVVNDPD
jgi:hypothetical protein